MQQPLPTLVDGCAAESLQEGVPFPCWDLEQLGEQHLLWGRDMLGQHPPEALIGPLADLGNQPFQDRRPRQEDGVVQQPGRRPVKEQAGPFLRYQA